MFFFQATFLLGKGERTNDDLEEVECTSKAISVMVSATWTDLKAYGVKFSRIPQLVSGFELAGTRKKDKNGQGRISLELHDNLHYKRCFLAGEL